MDCIDPALDVSLYNQRLFVKEPNLFFALKLSDIHEVPDVQHSISLKELQHTNISINKWTRAA